MTMSPQTDRERSEDEAAAWLVALSERPDDAALLAGFDEWRTESALNAEIWARTSRAYRLAGEGPPRHKSHWGSYAASREAEHAPRPAHPAPRAVRLTPRRLTAGVAVALAACLIVMAAPSVLLRLEADAVAATAEVRLLVLEDGSRVRLAPQSAVAVTFTTDERRVRLLKGDAFFEVVPNPSRPFRVMAGDTVATVLGTAFELRRGEDGAAVAVQHGHVRVDDDSTAPPTSAHLHDGDWLRVTRDGGMVRGSTRPDEIADWLRGKLIARDRPTGEVVDALRRYYKGAIIVQSSDFAARRVSGIYDLRDPVTTLRELAASHGASVRQISPWLLIVTEG